jgi:hypothetical protein
MGVSAGAKRGQNGEMDASEPPAPVTAPRWASHVFVALGVVLVPWTLWLAATLPEHHLARNFDVAWSGFDVALALSLIATGYGLYRGAAWTQGVAATAATLLVVDAWFDVLMSAPGEERMVALAMAAFAELPVALACAMLAFRASNNAAHAHRVQAIVHRLWRRRAAPPVPPAADGAGSD